MAVAGVLPSLSKSNELSRGLDVMYSLSVSFSVYAIVFSKPSRAFLMASQSGLLDGLTLAIACVSYRAPPDP